MTILVADDDPIFLASLEFTLTDWGYEVMACADGEAAWQNLQKDTAPRMAILDWSMPGLNGPDVCRRVRQKTTAQPPYLLLLTARDSKQDVVVGLQSGANDYVTKPFDHEELRARLQVARHVVELEEKLAERVRELEAALSQVRHLRNLLPICMYCKKIRNDQNYWLEIEQYLMEHPDFHLSHGICPTCYQQEMQKYLASRNPPGK